MSWKHHAVIHSTKNPRTMVDYHLPGFADLAHDVLDLYHTLLLRSHCSMATRLLSLQYYNLSHRWYINDLIHHIRTPLTPRWNVSKAFIVELSLGILPVGAGSQYVSSLLHHISVMGFECSGILVISSSGSSKVQRNRFHIKHGLFFLVGSLFRIRTRRTSVVHSSTFSSNNSYQDANCNALQNMWEFDPEFITPRQNFCIAAISRTENFS